MKSDSVRTSGKLTVKGKSRNDRFSVFAICLIIAAVIWLLIKLSEDHTTTIEYPIEYINLSKDKVLVRKSDSTVILTVKSFGFRLITEKYFQKQSSIIIDFKKLTLKQRNDHCFESYILTSNILSKISSQLKYSGEVVEISPDTLLLELEDLVQKKLPVRLNLKIKNEKQHYLYSPVRYSPDSVMVSGPYSVITKLDYVETELSEFNSLKDDKSFFQYIKMPLDNSLVKLSESKVEVTLDVEKYTETSFEINLNYLPDVTGENGEDLRIKTFPEKVKVICLVALKDYMSINENLFTATVFGKDILNNSNDRLKVKLTEFPEKVKILRIEPEAVEYIILKE